MKKFLSVFLYLAMISALSTTAFATGSPSLNSPSYAGDATGYDFYTINFDNDDSNADSPSSQSTADSKVYKAKEFVKSLTLESKGFCGLEAAIFDELDALKADDVQLSTYSVALPRATEYYGHYDGFMFQAAYTFHTQHYSDELFGKSKHMQFAEDAVGILMSIPGLPTVITLPFSLLTMAGTPIFTDSAVTQLTNNDEVTTRYIMIQDLNQQASLDPNTFVPVIMDQVRISKTTIITFPAGPYGSVEMAGESDFNEFPSMYFYDKNHNLSAGYQHYVAGFVSDPITHLVPTVNFSWD